MDRFQAYLDIVPLPVLVIIAMAGVFVFVITPSQLRLPLALTIMPVWLSAGQFTGLGAVSSAAKATGFVIYLVVAIAAVLHPSQRVRVPLIGYVPLLLSFPMLLLAAVRTGPASIEFVVQLQWTLLTIAAVLTASLVTDFASLIKMLRPIGVGFALALGLAGSSIVLSPGQAFASGLGRFQAWGANPNQIGTVFILSVSLLVFFGLQARAGTLRVFTILAAGFGGLLSLLTGSRSVVFGIVAILAPIGWALRRRPVIIVFGAIGAAGAVYLGFDFLREASLDRLTNLDSDRFRIFPIYLQFIAENPVLGVGLQSIEDSRPTDAHSHNAYLETMYMWGIPIALPMFIYAIASCVAAARLWIRCRKDPDWGTTAAFICNLVLIMYLHGLTTIVLFYPTYAWSFLAMVLSIVVIQFNRAMTTNAAYFDHESTQAYEQAEDVDGYSTA